jgi:SAM-dependent methyltransferase
MKDVIVAYLKKQSFQPGFLSIFLNPFYFIRRALYINIKSMSGNLKGKLLDFGCGRKPYENLFTGCEYIGIDVEESGHNHLRSKVDVYFDGKHIPFENETFDALFCTEVLEHLFNPDESLAEMYRVLKNNATLLITVPFAWNEHEVPWDFARYTSFGIKHLLEKHGFHIIEMKKTGTFARVIWQLWALYIFELLKKFKGIGYILSLIFIAPINLIGVILLPLLPKNDSLFFNNIILAEKRL